MLARLTGSLVLTVTGAAATVTHGGGSSPGLILAYIGSIGGLVASVATLIAALRRREPPQIVIVRSEEEADAVERSSKRRGRHSKSRGSSER